VLRDVSSHVLALAALSLQQRQLLGLPPGRCQECATRPPTVIDYPEGDPMEREHADNTGEACPRCGWSPTVISIRYVDDWKKNQQW
jgi:hypothetical protein